jgi:transcriptional regulator with XRE-family HTH domain
MSTKAERLATLVRELRGSKSQGQFARLLKVSRSTVTLWESHLALPSSKNLMNLARLKGWNFEEISAYMEEGKLPDNCEQIEHILNRVRELPSDQLIQVATVVAETLFSRTIS